MKQALSMWEENERRRLHILITELVEATKQRGMARLLAEKNPLGNGQLSSFGEGRARA